MSTWLAALRFLLAVGGKMGTRKTSWLPPSVYKDHAAGTRNLLYPRLCSHLLGLGSPESTHGDQLPRSGVCSWATQSVSQCQQGIKSDLGLLVANSGAVIVWICPLQRNCHHINKQIMYFPLFCVNWLWINQLCVLWRFSYNNAPFPLLISEFCMLYFLFRYTNETFLLIYMYMKCWTWNFEPRYNHVVYI